jgi:uncharacterized protein (TIGR02466 family)
MTEPVIHGIFPTPITFTSLDREFTPEELAIFEDAGKTMVSNAGNTTSADNYLLDRPGLENQKAEVLAAVQHYMDKVLAADKEKVTPYITQSWLNYTEAGQHHHKHAHPNSFLSGVLYIDADEKNDKIFFYNDGYKQIKTPPKEWNLFNSESWFFNVKTSQIVVFQSHLTHMVEAKAGDNRRCSLAFNTFLRGKIGQQSELTELLNL